MSRPHLLEALRDRVLLCDGGMGSRVQALTLDVEQDYWGQENCTEVLNLSRPDLVREIHRGYFEAGADMVETNTLRRLADHAGRVRASATGRSRSTSAPASWRARRPRASPMAAHRWVVGGIGPGTKLPSLGHIGYDALEAALDGAVPRPDRRRRRRAS